MVKKVQNVPENSAKTSLPWLHFKTDHELRREENKVEFLELSFELSLSIFCLLTVYF